MLHRDIKLDNILLDQEEGIKICDFGVSKIVRKGQIIHEQCGTPAYIAPEIIADTGYEGYYVDIWSLGILLYAMLCGTVPYKASNMQELHKIIVRGDYGYPGDVTIEARSLVDGMLQLEPSERLSLPEILAHPWLTKDQEVDIDDGLESNLTRMSKRECSSLMQSVEAAA